MLESESMREKGPIISFDDEKGAFTRSLAVVEGLRKTENLFKPGPIREFWKRVVSEEIAGRMDAYTYRFTDKSICDVFKDPNCFEDFMNNIYVYLDGHIYLRLLNEKSKLNVVSHIAVYPNPRISMNQIFQVGPNDFYDPDHGLKFGEKIEITPDMKDFPKKTVDEFLRELS